MLLAARWRRLAWPAAAIVLFVGYSRIYVGAHYPLDVLAGYAVGVIVGVIALAAWERTEPQA